MTRTTELRRSLAVLVPDDYTTDQKGSFLESLSAKILKRQSYEVVERVRFTGMEVDLLATHRPSGDEVYVECKFQRNSVSANVIDLMLGQAFRKRIERLALFAVGDLSKEAKGAVLEIKKDSRASLSYYDHTRILEALEDTSLSPRLVPSEIPAGVLQATLIVHPEQPFFWVLQEQRDGRPFQIFLLGEASKTRPTPRDIRALLDQHQLLEGLPIVGWIDEDNQTDLADIKGPTNEVVSPVVTADTVLDYRPCRPEDFVGRGELQKDIWGFLEQARADTTSTRLLALVGPSGSGKSSLVAKLASRFRNKKWKNRLFLYPVDVRSARGALFVAEAVLQALRSSSQAGFLSFDDAINIEDAEDILSSSSVSAAVEQLQNEQKLLVVFFDQFEEVFTKEELLPVFRAFRRFALDIHGKRPPHCCWFLLAHGYITR